MRRKYSRNTAEWMFGQQCWVARFRGAELCSYPDCQMATHIFHDNRFFFSSWVWANRTEQTEKSQHIDTYHLCLGACVSHLHLSCTNKPQEQKDILNNFGIKCWFYRSCVPLDVFSFFALHWRLCFFSLFYTESQTPYSNRLFLIMVGISFIELQASLYDKNGYKICMWLT